jgi:hypothetical protein
VSTKVEADPPLGSGVLDPRSDADSPSGTSAVTQLLYNVTALQHGHSKGISKSMQYTDGIVRWCMVDSFAPKEPTHVSQALNGPKWVSAMDSEHQALL